MELVRAKQQVGNKVVVRYLIGESRRTERRVLKQTVDGRLYVVVRGLHCFVQECRDREGKILYYVSVYWEGPNGEGRQ